MISVAENSGLLMVLMEPPASLEEEFNAWYDTEHLPQRRALPGFLSGSRWTCIAGWPRWAAIYELSSPEVLNSPEYAAVSGKNSTPWSRRILPRTIGYRRVVGAAVPSSEPAEPIMKASSSMVIARYSLVDGKGDAEAFRASALASLKEVRPIRTRAFIESDGAAALELWLLAMFDYPVVFADVSKSAGRVGEIGADLLNLYVPYRK